MAVLAAAGCTHAPTHEKIKSYDAQLSTRLGKAKQPEIHELLGEPQVRDLIGDFEVWVYQFENTGEPVRGRPEVAMVAPDHDEIMINFDREGTMQSYHVIIEGRKSRRSRKQ